MKIKVDDPHCIAEKALYIGKGTTLYGKDNSLCVDCIAVYPSGLLGFYTRGPLNDEGISTLMSLTHEDLDLIAEECTYKERGQAYRIIDLMAAYGELSFSGGNDLYRNIDSCIKSGSFIIAYKPCMTA